MPAAAAADTSDGDAHDQCPHHAPPSRWLWRCPVPPCREERPSRRNATTILSAVGRAVSRVPGRDRIHQPASAPNCLMPVDRRPPASPLWFADAAFNAHRRADRFPDRRNAHSAVAGLVERLPAPGIRHRRISGALVRRLSRAQPFDHVWPLPCRRIAARFLAGRPAAGRRRGLGHRRAAADAPIQCPSVRIVGDRCGARRDDGAAVARKPALDRHLRRPCRARVPRAGVARRPDRARANA